MGNSTKFISMYPVSDSPLSMSYFNSQANFTNRMYNEYEAWSKESTGTLEWGYKVKINLAGTGDL